MTSYQRGETVSERAYIYTEADVLVNSDEITITIIDPSGTTIIDEDYFTIEAIGTYVYSYTLSETAEIGLWLMIVKATLSDIVKIRNDSFRVTN